MSVRSILGDDGCIGINRIPPEIKNDIKELKEEIKKLNDIISDQKKEIEELKEIVNSYKEIIFLKNSKYNKIIDFLKE